MPRESGSTIDQMSVARLERIVASLHATILMTSTPEQKEPRFPLFEAEGSNLNFNLL